ncbi:conserved hypothetical protein [Gammaproteobacteria bacterium]
MGFAYAELELINLLDKGLHSKGYITPEVVRKVHVKALVDSSAYKLCINENINAQLGLEKVDEIFVEMADGTLRKMNVVGPIEIRFETRRTIGDAVVLPGEVEVLLGVIPLEDMDVVIDPLEERVKLPADRPYIAKRKLK